MSWLLMLSLSCSEVDHDDHEGHDDHQEESEGHDEHDGERVVELTPEAVASARIRVDPAKTSVLAGTVSLPGRIALDPRKEALVSAWISGQLDAIRVRPGDVVTKGQLLAKVQSPELGEAVAAFRAAKAADDAADAKLARLVRLEGEGVTARSQVLAAEAEHAAAVGAMEAAEERLRILGVDPTLGDPHEGDHFPSQVPIRAPLAGKVLMTDATVGERVEPGATLFHIGDLDEVWLLVDVYEGNLGAVSTDQGVTFTVEAWPQETFVGTVEQIGDWVEPQARTVEVRVVVPNADHRLKPNMFAEAQLTVAANGPVGVVLPAEALVDLDGEHVVFIEEEPGHYEAREVQVASTTTDQVQIAQGVEAGEPVVIDGAFALKSELEKGELGEGHAH